MDRDGVRQRVAELISEATGGEVAVADLLAGGSLVALGVDSLGLLRLVDSLELEYGVEVEFNSAAGGLDTVDDVLAVLATARTG